MESVTRQHEATITIAIANTIVLSSLLSLLISCFVLLLLLIRLAASSWLHARTTTTRRRPSHSLTQGQGEGVGEGEGEGKFTVAFFHPYANDGGGGERVLWCAVRAVQEQYASASCVIYTGDDATWPSLKARAFDRFGVALSRPMEVVKLRHRRWVEAATFPRFTLIGQSLGSMVLGYEALTSFTPSVFIDTSGYAFTYPLAWLAGAKVACYVHYPTISTDMLERVKQRRAMYNNDERISRSWILSLAKVLYYRSVAFLYGLAGRFADVVMVNSRWTEGHIVKLWGNDVDVKRVYPPCNTDDLQEFPLDRPRGNLVSVAQFRPEKAHSIQLEAVAMVLAGHFPARAEDSTQPDDELSVPRFPDLRLELIGSSRHKEDDARIAKLRLQAKELGIEDRVDFLINVPYRDLVQRLGKAIAGLHSMIDEHFGIGVVEYMAAGAIAIAHNSGGPRLDIVCPDEQGRRTGFLATTKEEYAEAIAKVLLMGEEERKEIASAGRIRAQLFSETEFVTGFKNAIKPLFDLFEALEKKQE